MSKNKNKEIIKKNTKKNITDEQKQRYREAIKNHQKKYREKCREAKK